MRTALALALLVPLAACGGKSRPASTVPADRGDGQVEDTSGGDLVPPERMDEIKTLLDRKRTAAARCLSDAINAGKLPRSAAGHVALEFTISTGGAAEGVKVIETSIEDETVQECVMEKVRQIDFGSLPSAIDWSYTYAFESM